MADLRQFFTQSYPLPEDAMEELIQTTTLKTYRKGQYLLRKGQTCKHLFFINERLVKSFFLSAEKEFVMRFFAGNALFSASDSFIPGTRPKSMLIPRHPTPITHTPPNTPHLSL